MLPSLSGNGFHSFLVVAARRELPPSSSGVVGTPLEEEEEEGTGSMLRWAWSETWGGAGGAFLEMERKKRLRTFEGERLGWCCKSCKSLEMEVVSDLSDRFAAKTAAMRRMRGGAEEGGEEEGGGWREKKREEEFRLRRVLVGQ